MPSCSTTSRPTSSQLPRSRALTAAVRDGGLGLLTLGGRHAYSLGGYAHSPLNQLLPVASLVPGDLQRRNLAIELVLDRSGSMSDSAGGVRKITMAQSAARQTAQFVGTHRDELGIVDFDIVPHVLITMRRVSPGASQKRVLARINGLQADGGTDIYLGLQAGLKQLLASKSPNRHVILLSDGISQPHNYSSLLREFAQHKISVATVALGSDVDATLLRGIATATGGNFYATKNARELPRIFVKETRLSAKPVQVSGRQQVLAQGSSPVGRSLAGKALPVLAGNVVTHLKAGAQVDLIARSSSATTDPALAEWGFGSGRVVSWTPGLGAPWAPAWTSQPELWNDAVRWVARGVPAAAATATAEEGTATALRVDLAAGGPTPQTSIAAVLERPGGRQRVVLEETSPSIYTASVAALPVGSYGLTLALPAALGGQQRVLVDVPYAAEWRPSDLGRPALGELAAQTGGKLLAPGDLGAVTGDERSLRVPLLVLALVLYLVSIGARLLVRARATGPQATVSDASVGIGEEQVERLLVAASPQVADARHAALLPDSLGELLEALGVVGGGGLVERRLDDAAAFCVAQLDRAAPRRLDLVACHDVEEARGATARGECVECARELVGGHLRVADEHRHVAQRPAARVVGERRLESGADRFGHALELAGPAHSPGAGRPAVRAAASGRRRANAPRPGRRAAGRSRPARPRGAARHAACRAGRRASSGSTSTSRASVSRPSSMPTLTTSWRRRR